MPPPPSNPPAKAAASARKNFSEWPPSQKPSSLDARSADKFAMLHVAGAKNLPLPDFPEAALAQLIPDKSTPILIYCNNNFLGEEIALASKRPVASLNIYTVNALHAYGYRNVHELAPLRNVSASKLPFAGTRAAPSPTEALLSE